jgi:pimeloyl-ACP methyl ester carboxylesterase
MEERFVDNDGVRIRYLDRTPDGAVGSPVIFVPGLVDVDDDYEEAFVDFERRALVVELRGRGGSDAPVDEYSAEDQASDIDAVAEAEGVGPFHLMTFSRGTTPGLLFAFRRRRDVLSISIGDYLASEIGLPVDFVDRMWEGRWRGTPNSARVQRHALAGIQASSRPRELWEDVGRMGVPVLVARGGAGSFVDDAAVDRYRSAIRHVEIVDIPDSGHDIFRPSRTAYPRAVLEFIARRAAGT